MSETSVGRGAIDGIEIGDEGIVVDAAVLAEAFGLSAREVQPMMRSGAITSRCEKGVDADEGRWRLTFFHAGRAVRLTVDGTGKLLGRSTFDAPKPPRPGSGRAG